MQIGDPTIIAEKLRCPVVHHFRQADMAVGGQGAPLVPWTDFVLFRDKRKNRIIQNIGGIANLTYLPAACDVTDVVAFDTGPGNLLIDGMTRIATKGREQFDRGGRRAAKGRVHPELFHHLMRHPFLLAAPPKSCGREQFGESYIADLRKRFARLRLLPNDWIATVTHFSAACMILGYAWLCDARRTEYPPMDEIILCGGGAKNTTLVRMLSRCLHAAGRRIPVTSMNALGISTQAKEGVSFAMLAAARIDGVPANLPRVTGAKNPVLLGDICDLGLK
jgi:anhydro-N-acetylmuramic acid kinase